MKADLHPCGPDDQSRLVIAPSDIAFVICVEGNVLSSQALLLCESLRRYGGAYSNCAIWAISPRSTLPVSDLVQAQLRALDVNVVSIALNKTGSAYGTINRIVAGAWAEQRLTTEFICMLDTDMAFVRPPVFHVADAGARPVDAKGMATAGADDPREAYWAELCELAGIGMERLPHLSTTWCRSVIRASYNGGFLVVRRALGILAETERVFLKAFYRDLRPSRHVADVLASAGHTGSEAASWWGSSQAALSVAISARTDDILLYDAAYNVPLHSLVGEPVLPVDARNPVLIHYHYLAAQSYRYGFIKTLDRIGCAADVQAWIAERLAQLEWQLAGVAP
ncbi:MAG: hypothetical protein B7Z10_09245 [Rhodobacterales bacterium 32-66-7]|nr:MAG: hypothetical protein B7Z10_09245 [Rhodobacterales bacterium 32-66-7]